MLGLILVLAFYGAAFLAVFPIAKKRLGKVSLPDIYANPAATRRSWWFRAPGPLLLILAWYLVPLIIGTGDLLEAKFPLWMHPDKAKVVQIAGQRAKLAALESLDKEVKDITARAERQKTSKGWFKLPDAQIEMARDKEISEAQEKYRTTIEKTVAEAEQYEFQKQFPEQAKALKASLTSPVRMAFLMLWSLSFFVGVVWIWRLYRKNRTRGGFHGFARWSKWSEVAFNKDHRWLIPMWVNYRSTTRNWKLWERYIGQVGLAILAPPEGDAVCSHYILLGHTGSGKMAAVFSHIMATSKTPVIYQDEKAECGPCCYASS